MIFLHVYLAFPAGHLRSGFERLLVAAGYVAAIGLQLLKMALDGVGSHNLLALSRRPDAAHAVEITQLLSISAICLVGIGVLVSRRRQAGKPLRRPVALLIDSFTLGLLLIAILFVSGAFEATVFQTIQRLTLFVIGISPLAFLFGLLDARLARSAVGELFVELRADPSPTGLQDSLARALRDPSLTLAYWLPEFESWADLDGRAVDLPEPGSGRATTLIERDGERLVALSPRPRRSTTSLSCSPSCARRLALRSRTVGFRPSCGLGSRRCGLAGAARRGRPGGAPAPGAQPSRRRPAAADRPLARAGASRGRGRRGTRRRGAGSRRLGARSPHRSRSFATSRAVFTRRW